MPDTVLDPVANDYWRNLREAIDALVSFGVSPHVLGGYAEGYALTVVNDAASRRAEGAGRA